MRILFSTVQLLMGLNSLSLAWTSNEGEYSSVPEFKTCAASSSPSAFKDFVFSHRIFAPYGYDALAPDSGNSTRLGYAFGMGALEQFTYDYKEKYVYTMSEQGFVFVIDYNDASSPKVISPEHMIDLSGGMPTDVQVCPDQKLLFVSVRKGAENPGEVLIYSTLTRSSDGASPLPLEYKMTVTVGSGPDMVAPNPDCTILAVANEGEGSYDDSTGLLDPQGSVTLIDLTTFATREVSLNKWTDEELIAKGVHLPLSKNAMIYWNEHSSISGEINFESAINNYEPAMGLEPEYLAWSADGSEVFVNLQENSALVRVDVESATAVSIDSYGLKDWSETPIDIVKDGGCSNMPKVPGLYSVRMPDSIASFVLDGMTYVVTANEGDDKEYGSFEEKIKAKDLFDGNTLEPLLLNGQSPVEIFDPTNFQAGTSAQFNGECDSTSWCATKMSLTLGSSMVDYETNNRSPALKKLVAFGGRGISIYKIPQSFESPMSMEWDSADELEVEGCSAFPWAHNGVQDEEFSPVGGVLYQTSDQDMKDTIEEVAEECLPAEGCALGETVDERSQKDGPAPETVVVGKACGRFYAVTVAEKNSIGFLYDITDVSEPVLAKVFHLTPASKTLSPGLAYDNRSIGEIDAESILFLDEMQSPTGKAAVMFAGAWSGTLSLFEFECNEYEQVDNCAEEHDHSHDHTEDKPSMAVPENEEDFSGMDSPAASFTISTLSVAFISLVLLSIQISFL